MANTINTGIINDYSITPKSLTEYTAMRGIMDFTELGQFDQFETGYSFLSVLQMPKFMTVLGSSSPKVEAMNTAFQHMLEYEFRGFSGLPNVIGDGYELTDGANSVGIIANVSRDTSVSLTANYFERRGGLITKYTEYYLTGIKDPMSKARTYHGLIANNLLQPSLENEVFTMLYYVTDNTYLRIEKAFLLCDVQLSTADMSIYDSNKGDISNRELSIEFRCFPVTGLEVAKAAKSMLNQITGVSVGTPHTAGNVTYGVTATSGVAALDSSDYKYGIMNSDYTSHIPELTDLTTTV